MLAIKETKHQQYIYIVLLGLVFLSFSINLYKVSGLHAPGIFDSDYGTQLDLDFDIYEDGAFLLQTKLPYSFSSPTTNKEIELVATLPASQFIDKSFISFRASGYSVKIDVDNQEIYRFYQENVQDYGGAYWHFIKLPDNSSSKQIKIHLLCPTKNCFSQNLFPIYQGSKGYLLVKSFGLTFESLCFGIIFIVFGLVFLGNIIFFNRSINNSFLLSLSLLLICLGCWFLFQSGARQIMGFTNPAFSGQMSFFCMISLPFFLWFYVSTNYKKIGEYKIFTIASFIILSLYIPFTLLSFVGFHYTSFLLYMGIILLIFILSILAIAMQLYIKGEKSLLSCIVAILCILISIIFEEILLVLKINITCISILHAGMALAAIIFIYKSIGNLIEKQSEVNEAKLLKKLAYIDVITLMLNRNAYERFLEEKGNCFESIGVILADINGLKIINDTFGHRAGDILLQKKSKDLKDLLPECSELYRVGGDEFVGLIPRLQKDDFLTFVETIKKHYSPTKNDYGMAIGACFYEKSKYDTIAKAIEEADRNMYINKEMQKNMISKIFINNGLTRESSLMRQNNSQ